MSQRVRQSAKSVYNRGKQILLPKVRDAVLKWAGLQHQPFVDAFSSRRSRLFHSYWDAEDNALQQNWSYDPSSKRNNKMLWLHPPQHLLSEVVQKILLDEACGILIVPVQTQFSWSLEFGGSSTGLVGPGPLRSYLQE